jgi:MFS-type transporter involved in bile tolerance (Atg22 family)
MTVLLLAWGCVLLLLAAGSGAWMPLATVTAIGCCLGGTLSALRGFLAEIVEPSDSAAFFGVATVVGRIATALGPALFSVATLLAGQTAALLMMLLVLLAGGALILRHLARAPLVEQEAVQPAGNP